MITITDLALVFSALLPSEAGSSVGAPPAFSVYTMARGVSGTGGFIVTAAAPAHYYYGDPLFSFSSVQQIRLGSSYVPPEALSVYSGTLGPKYSTGTMVQAFGSPVLFTENSRSYFTGANAPELGAFLDPAQKLSILYGGLITPKAGDCTTISQLATPMYFPGSITIENKIYQFWS